MKKVRIVRRTCPDSKVKYVIQQKHFLFFWSWVDAGENEVGWCQDSFDSFLEAKNNLCWFDGTESREEIVYGDV